jgi:hypothetical protein
LEKLTTSVGALALDAQVLIQRQVVEL